eukprot:5233154-Prymnesium_polylepis.1
MRQGIHRTRPSDAKGDEPDSHGSTPGGVRALRLYQLRARRRRAPLLLPVHCVAQGNEDTPVIGSPQLCAIPTAAWVERVLERVTLRTQESSTTRQPAGGSKA